MLIDVILPVGPGHDEVSRRAIASVHVAQDNAAAAGVEATTRVAVVDDQRGEIGRSAARNDAVQESSAEWVFFLDADDMMHPDALVNAMPTLEGGEFDAVWGLCHQMEGDYILPRYELPRIVSRDVLLRHHPMTTVKIGHFVRQEVAAAHPFNVDMDCGEDWDYYLRVWDDARCVKIPAPFYIKVRGQHSTGPRSATGAQWSETVDAMLAQARGD